MRWLKILFTASVLSVVFVIVAIAPISLNTPNHAVIAHAQTGNTDLDGFSDVTEPKTPEETKTKPPGECGWKNISFYDCIWYPAVTLLHNGAVSLGKLLVSFSSSVFNWAFEKTVTNLSGTLDDLKITLGIETVWGAFRDIANIIIIGVMVYIAIATIIGLEEYGYKKLLASTLIIATLINFSLFFSRFIIDAANIVSHQVYKSITNQSGGMTIGDTIIKKGGISTLTVGTKETNQYIQKTGVWEVVLSAFVIFFLLSAFSAVLLYGSFLLISRGIVLTFLMITSSVAFASYLLPGWRKGQYGWDTWKKTLIDAAVFGPLLTLLLWASLTLLGSAGSAGSYGSISDSISGGIKDSKNIDGSWKALMVLIFTIAFLYISIKIAHELSGKISGFNMAARVPGFGAALASRGTGLLARSTLGYGGKVASDWMKKNNFGSNWAGRLAIRSMNTMQKSTFDALTNKNVAKAMGGIGVTTGFMKDAGKGGYTGVKKRQAEEATRIADETMASKEVVKGKADKAAEKARKEAETALNPQITQANQSLQGFTQALQANQQALQAAQKQKDTVAAKHDQDVRIAEQEVVMAQTPQAKNTARANLARTMRDRQSALAQEDQRIATAHSAVTGVEHQIETTRNTINTLEQSITAAATSAGENVTKRFGTAESRSKDIATSRLSTGYGARYWFSTQETKENDVVAKQISDVIKSKREKKRLKNLASAIQEENPPPATPTQPNTP